MYFTYSHRASETTAGGPGRVWVIMVGAEDFESYSRISSHVVCFVVAEKVRGGGRQSLARVPSTM